ncbi:MAG: redoxin domain-containing protein, partial [Gemmataceae bacterium]|nr:redoxin domain-containing protein [Gemmataceae bacterium]
MRSWETWAAAWGCGALAWGLLTLLLASGKKRGRLGERLAAALAGLAVVGAVLAVPEGRPKKPLPPEAVRSREAMDFFESMGPAPKAGSDAPDFDLPDPRTGEKVRLAGLGQGRPVVLVFGSWGCDVFCRQFPAVAALHEEFGSQAEFVFVQVAEAPHALPARLGKRLEEAGMAEETPENRDRRAVLSAEAMGLPFRLVLDGEDRAVCKRYAAFPQRLVVIHGGKVAHDAGVGWTGMPSSW